MKGFTIYTANCTGNAKNCIYPTEVTVQDIASLERAMQRDHVCAMYRDHKRSAAGFEWSDCIPMDCDNDHSEDPAQWKQPQDVQATFPNVTFAVCYSRNHMKEKNGKSARPRFHCYFPIDRVRDGETYAAMKQRVYKKFPFFDDNALDIARFCFGTETPEVMFFAGDKTVDQVLPAAITAGNRNATLSQKAGKLIKRYGDTAKAEQLFKIEAERCVPPLSEDELASIWSSAKKFGKRIADRDDYIPPEQFNTPVEKLEAMRPESNRRYAWSDIGGSRLFADYYKDIVRYVPERKSWYCYADGVWSADVDNSPGLFEISCRLSALFLRLSQESKAKDSLCASAGAKTYSTVVEMMQREVKCNLCVEDFAKANYISTSYLKKLFGHYAGISPKRYYHNLRTSEAKRLLRSGAAVSEVSERMNFSSPAYFTVFFKNQTGSTPTQYRKKYGI